MSRDMMTNVATVGIPAANHRVTAPDTDVKQARPHVQEPAAD